MKIEIEIPDYIDKKLLTEDLITEMKISAYIPLVELNQMTEAGVARHLNLSRVDTSTYFGKIGYTNFLDTDRDLENDPDFKRQEEENIKFFDNFLLNKIKKDKNKKK